jgi:peptide/nickel transport system ATP-binding protein
MAGPLLQVQNLQTYFFTEEGVVKSVNNVSFDIYPGETVGVVGESGCGKSVTALSILQLIKTPGEIVGGKILFNSEDLLEKTKKEILKIRGNHISMIFQDPMTSLNPAFTIGNQIMEVITLHQKKNKKEATELTINMLRKVGIPEPERRIHEYPHQISGGMKQRVMIAMALSCNPQLLIADEPTTALDVTVQKQILDLMKQLKDDFGTAIMLITHDLGVVAEICSRVIVMYAGNVVEYADVKSLFESPQHPYTLGLINSIPKITESRERLQTIEGYVPSANRTTVGCGFLPRCQYTDEQCRTTQPELQKIGEGHYVRCWHPLNENR